VACQVAAGALDTAPPGEKEKATAGQRKKEGIKNSVCRITKKSIPVLQDFKEKREGTGEGERMRARKGENGPKALKPRAKKAVASKGTHNMCLQSQRGPRLGGGKNYKTRGREWRRKNGKREEGGRSGRSREHILG